MDTQRQQQAFQPEVENERLFKIWVDKERVLWYFPLQLIGTPGNFYNGRSRPGDRARVWHISHHSQSCSARKRDTS